MTIESVSLLNKIIAFLRREKEVISQLQEAKPRDRSTALCSFLHNEQLNVANLGDSQAVIFQEDKFAEQERINAKQKGRAVINNRLEGELARS